MNQFKRYVFCCTDLYRLYGLLKYPLNPCNPVFKIRVIKNFGQYNTTSSLFHSTFTFCELTVSIALPQ